MKVNPNTVQKSLVELENEKLIYTESTNGKFVTSDEKLIEKVKDKLAKEKINNYIKNMNNIKIIITTHTITITSAILISY